MSTYTVKPYDTYSRRSDFMEPLSRTEYEKRARVVVGSETRLGSLKSPFGSDKVDISSATGRESLLYKLRQRYGSPNGATALIGSLSPIDTTLKSLYSGVGAIKRLVNSYV